MDKNEKIELESKINRMLSIFRKTHYTDEDKEKIIEFIKIQPDGENEFSKILIECILDRTLREKLIEILRLSYVIESKEPDLKYFIDNSMMFEFFSRTCKEYLNTPELLRKISVYDLDILLKDYYSQVTPASSKGLQYLDLLMDRMTTNEFKVSASFFLAKYYMQSSMKYKEDNQQYFSFAKKYIQYLIENNEFVSFENDNFWNNFSSEQIDELKEYYKKLNRAFTLQIEDKKEEITIEEVTLICWDIERRISQAHQEGKELSEIDKKLIENYFQNYYHLSLEYLNTENQNDDVERLFQTLIDMTVYKFFNEKDENFRKTVFPNFLNDLLEVQNPNEKIVFLLCELDVNEKVTEKLKSFIREYPKLHKEESKRFDFSRFSPVKKYMETYIDRSIKTTGSAIPKNAHEFVKFYIELCTTKPDFDIFQEQYISDILQLIENNRIGEPLKTEFHEIIKRNLRISQNLQGKEEKNKVEEIIEDIQDKPVTEVELDKIIKYLQTLKISNGRIYSQKILYFILRQVLDENSCLVQNPDKYKCFVERMLEDYARFNLPSKINGTCFFIRDYLGKETIGGAFNPSYNSIEYKRSEIYELLYNKNPRVIETILHENVHANQDYDLKHSQLDNYYKYLMLKEMAMSNSNSDFYYKNYSLIFFEIEAREKSRVQLVNLLTSMPEDVKNQVINNMMIDMVNEGLEYRRQYRRGIVKWNAFKEDLPREKIVMIFDEFIKTHPEIVQKKPLLKMEYNDDGSLKNVCQIAKDIDEMENPISKMKIYIPMLVQGNIFQIERFENDISALLNYDIKNARSILPISYIYDCILSKFLNDMENLPDRNKVNIINGLNMLKQRFNFIKEKQENGEELSFSERALQTIMNNEKYTTEIEKYTNAEAHDHKEVTTESVENVDKEGALLAEAYELTTIQERNLIKRIFVKLSQKIFGKKEENKENFLSSTHNSEDKGKD